MSYFRQLKNETALMQETFSRDDRWLIVINADPDAMASALALRRIMSHRVADVGIARINTISRPDNLAMERYCRIPMMPFIPTVAAQYDRFAMVDSQPHHNPAFAAVNYSLVIDHHPLSEEFPVIADFKDIEPHYGSCSALLTEYLYNFNIRPGKLLATALMFGIKTDTGSFERKYTDIDSKAFRYLSKYGEPQLLARIARSEFKLSWLDYFSKAFKALQNVRTGKFCYLGKVESPDILVIVADFFMRVHGVRWVAVAGLCEEKAVVIFRGDGIVMNLGEYAHRVFGDIGGAGGHSGMARAEIPLESLKGANAKKILLSRLSLPLGKGARPALSDKMPADAAPDQLPNKLPDKSLDKLSDS